MNLCVEDISNLSCESPAAPESPVTLRALNDAFDAPRSTQRVEISPEDVRRGLGRLVLVIVRLVHDLLERQAVRRMEVGDLSDAELDRLGTTLMLQAKEIEKLRKEFGLEEADLNLDLGPVGRLL